MTGADLMAEFWSYTEAVTEAHLVRLESLGVPRAWSRDLMAPRRFGAALARLERNGTWTPDPAGTPVCVLPETPVVNIYDPAWPVTEVSDLIAFTPGEPGRWWVRTGNAALLNAIEVDAAAILDRPLILHADPLEWMRAAGDGAVIIDWRCFLPLHLGGAPSITCMDMDLAERLDRRLKRPPGRQRIEIAQTEAMAA